MRLITSILQLVRRRIAAVGHFVHRLALARRYFLSLKYSWHLAWVKAERGMQ